MFWANIWKNIRIFIRFFFFFVFGGNFYSIFEKACYHNKRLPYIFRATTLAKKQYYTGTIFIPESLMKPNQQKPARLAQTLQLFSFFISLLSKVISFRIYETRYLRNTRQRGFWLCCEIDLYSIIFIALSTRDPVDIETQKYLLFFIFQQRIPDFSHLPFFYDCLLSDPLERDLLSLPKW